MIAPASSQPAESRPRFHERQVLGADELGDEQAYQVAMRRRHLVGSHSWGIVSGLALAAARDRVAVQPGLAVDGFGRALVVARPQLIAPEALEELGGDPVDVWLLYGRVASTPARRGRWDCGPGRHSRWREQPCLRLTAARDPLEPRRPPGVSNTWLEYEPHARAPDGPVPAWPVYLGRATPGKKSGGMRRPYRVDLGQRPYAGLVGESVRNPLGSEGLRVGGDERGAAVRLRDPGGAQTEVLAVDGSGNTTVRADTGLTGELRIAGIGNAAGGLSFTPLPAVPEAATPWSAYRVTVPEAGRTLSQLRLEVGHPGDKGDPLRYALGVGAIDDNGDFERGLTVTSGCTVIVGGDLNVEGLLSLGPVGADPDDPRFRGAVLLRWMRGITEASNTLDQAYSAEMSLTGLGVTGDVITRLVDLTVTLTNTGAVPIASVRAAVTISGLAADPVVSGLLTDKPIDLEAGESVVLKDSFDLSATAAVSPRAVVGAGGIGPAGNPVSASAEATVVFTGGIN
jgi:hypothetical protein